MASEAHFEAHQLLGTSIRDLGLTIEGTDLEPLVREFRKELEQAGITRLKPHIYLSDEWGVPFETIAIGIPFYLARADLIALHAERAGHVEGAGRADLLRYLRHEMGHVVNYALSTVRTAGLGRAIRSDDAAVSRGIPPRAVQPSFRAPPSGLVCAEASRRGLGRNVCSVAYARTRLARRVRRLPGGARQARVLRQNDERAAFPRSGRRCDRTRRRRQPARGFTRTFTTKTSRRTKPLPPGLDGALRSIFDDATADDATQPVARLPAHGLILLMEPDLVANVFRWTGHFPDRTRRLLRHLAERARVLNQVYSVDHEIATTVAVTTLVTALAMNHVHQRDLLVLTCLPRGAMFLQL